MIDNGYLYLCQPPLYRVSTGKVTRYAARRKERRRREGAQPRRAKTKNVSVNASRASGEMNADQLGSHHEPRYPHAAQGRDRKAPRPIPTRSQHTHGSERVEPRRDFIRGEAARSATWHLTELSERGNQTAMPSRHVADIRRSPRRPVEAG